MRISSQGMRLLSLFNPNRSPGYASNTALASASVASCNPSERRLIALLKAKVRLLLVAQQQIYLSDSPTAL
ncbi:hypothetical protein [Chroococcidiopsis sp. CCALA 051]|uniref:hypothetical protein n=1 Tax=Chroococcidiopsis sp. CCALA 051 TaxID=869949 RepID=UPI0011B25A48|nr:hypothetical protein [Chroococcidiopsis sp. CCALA 051]